MSKYNLKSKILIVDDSEMNRALLSDMLENKYEITEAENGARAIELLEKEHDSIDLVLLDLVMPDMDGFEVLSVMNGNNWTEKIPVIMISSENSESFIERAYDLGVTDFISRPFESFIVNRRIENTIMLYAKQKKLISMVSKQFLEREKSNSMMIDILSHIVEFRNGESGAHVLHIHIITELLLNRLQTKTDKYDLSKEDIRMITMVSALHDIGKIGIPDEILNKPGKLTSEEFNVIKTHTTIGSSMLTDLKDYKDEALIRVAYEVCRWHHERYDGRGYPDGLKGDEIPISAQIVALADVYDALTSERCYKAAYTHEEAIKMICNGECGAFQSLLLECLTDVADQIDQKIHTTVHVAQEEDVLTSLELIDYKSVLENDPEENAKNKIIKLSVEATVTMLSQLHRIFDVVRLIDVNKHMQIEIDSDGNMNRSENKCFGLWNKNEECNNCISYHAFAEKGQFTKLEFLNTDIYYVIARYIEIENTACVLELAFEVDESFMLSAEKDKESFLNIKFEESYKRIYTDSLTEAFNRRYFDEKASTCETIDGIAMFDIDEFKHINDTYGHEVGDIVLKTVSSKVSSAIRDNDCLIRYGGDEFLILFASVSEKDFAKVLERVRNTVLKIKFESYPEINLSISIGGVYKMHPITDAVKLSDKLMYDVKQDGKNSVKIYKNV